MTGVQTCALPISVYNEAQFTLEPYLEVSDAQEKIAAKSLLEALKAMAVA